MLQREVSASSSFEAQLRARFILLQRVPLGPGSNISGSPPIGYLVLDYLSDLGDVFTMLKGDNLALNRNRIEDLLCNKDENSWYSFKMAICGARTTRNSPRGLLLCIYTVPRTHDLTACRLRRGIATRTTTALLSSLRKRPSTHTLRSQAALFLIVISSMATDYWYVGFFQSTTHPAVGCSWADRLFAVVLSMP
jgi:hypothetical protein